jgi:putative Holliday junction resolvase
MRFVGVDFGRRRIGLAVSDDSATLARPWQTVQVAPGQPPAAAARVVAAVVRAGLGPFEAEPFAGIVIGLPRRLNGADNEQTPIVRTFADRLASETGLAVHLQDERLSSHEADERLGARERDWRIRKQKLDAASAAIILQDFLDARPRSLTE